MINLLIVDDHALIRRGLKLIFEETPDIRVRDEARDSTEALHLLAHRSFDALILDISLPGRSGLDLLKQVHDQYPDLPILVLSVHPENQYALRVIKAGASGYLTKDSPPEELIDAIRKIVCGKKHLTDKTVESIVTQINHTSEEPLYTTLSDREYQILIKLANGQSISEIAQDLALSIKTISTYRTRILQKLQLKNTAEIICYALRQGLV